jgi:hypothetical protein
MVQLALAVTKQKWPCLNGMSVLLSRADIP